VTFFQAERRNVQASFSETLLDFIGNKLPLFSYFFWNVLAHFKDEDCFFSKFVDIITIVPWHFVYCDALRIISEFIKISDKILVLEKILETTRVLCI
jgi:hypothetical protein